MIAGSTKQSVHKMQMNISLSTVIAGVMQRKTLLLSACWLAVCVGSLLALEVYKARPGQQLVAPHAASAAAADQGSGLRILMFVHPECPCTRSSLHELRKLLDAARTKPQVEIVVVPHLDNSHQSALISEAESMPGTIVRSPENSNELQRYGALTSGYVVVMGDRGRELFCGGITRSRGHEGGSTGGRAVADLLAGRRPEVTQTLVYGCSLLDPAAAGSRQATDSEE